MGSTVGPAELSWRERGMGLADILCGAIALRMTLRKMPAVSS